MNKAVATHASRFQLPKLAAIALGGLLLSAVPLQAAEVSATFVARGPCESMVRGHDARTLVPVSVFHDWDAARSQASSASAGTPCFLKSWKRCSTPFAVSQVRAFLTVSQLGMP